MLQGRGRATGGPMATMRTHELASCFESMDNGGVHWVHIDPDEVVALREGLFTGSPPVHRRGRRGRPAQPDVAGPHPPPRPT